MTEEVESVNRGSAKIYITIMLLILFAGVTGFSLYNYLRKNCGESIIKILKHFKNLKTLNLSNFNTSNITDMRAMFYGCSSLEELDLSNFNTSNVTKMSEYEEGMFQNCSSLERLNISSFDTSNVVNMASMFKNCSSLEELDMRSATFSNITNTVNTFISVPNTATIYIDCAQEDVFVSKFGSLTGLTTVNNEACTA